MALEQSLEAIRGLCEQGLAGVVDGLIEEAARLTGSTISYFALMNEAEDTLIMIGWSKTVMENCKMIDKPIVYPLEQTGLWGDCVRERGPVVTNDYKACIKPTKKGHPQGHVEVIRHMNVCMMDGKRVLGVLGVGNKADNYSTADVGTLQAFANGCAGLMPRDEMEAIAG